MYCTCVGVQTKGDEGGMRQWKLTSNRRREYLDGGRPEERTGGTAPSCHPWTFHSEAKNGDLLCRKVFVLMM